MTEKENLTETSPPNTIEEAAAAVSSSDNALTGAESTIIGSDDKAVSCEDQTAALLEIAAAMTISELKMKLMAKGVLTSTFCEKSEFVRAYAELMVKEKLSEKDSSATQDSTAAIPTDRNHTPDDGDVDDENDDDNVDQSALPKSVQYRVTKLRELNDQREALMKQYLVERSKLEAKYHFMLKPLYEQRKNIVVGRMDAEIAKECSQSSGDTHAGNDDDDNEEGIPQFWVVALSQMPVTAEMIYEQDLDCLGYLQDITCEDYENGEGLTLKFYFAPNDYFENAILTKSYDVPNLLTADEPILKNVRGCEIQWKAEKSLMFVEVAKQQRGKGKNAGQVRTITKKEKSESFFHFFTPPKMPSLDGMNEEEAARVEAAFEEDYDIAQAFRSHLIPKAVMWFLGDAMEKEMEEAMEGMEFPPRATGCNASPSGDEASDCKQS